jgi:excisionase family DNA binding protein
MSLRALQNSSTTGNHSVFQKWPLNGPVERARAIPEPLLNDEQAGRFLGGLHPKTVQRMARRGEIPSYRVAKFWRYRASELNDWLVLHSSGQINPPAQNRKENL